jgi:hypothetical protein
LLNKVARNEIETVAENPSPPEQSDYLVDAPDHLFAAFVALAIVTVYTPLRTLHSLLTWTLTALLPLATYQDILLLAVLAWMFHGLFAIAEGQRTRRLVAAVGWALCLTIALYTYLSDILYLIIRRPLTVGLIVAADNLRAIQASAESIITPGLVGALVMAPICTVLIASILIGLAPEELRRMRSAFFSATGLVIVAAYFVGARAWAGPL